MLAKSIDEQQAEAAYRHAIQIAQKQQAKLFKLRATTSLARLWLDQGRRAEAGQILAPVYKWFTEGLDSPDLTEARALLHELSAKDLQREPS